MGTPYGVLAPLTCHTCFRRSYPFEWQSDRCDIRGGDRQRQTLDADSSKSADDDGEQCGFPVSSRMCVPTVTHMRAWLQPDQKQHALIDLDHARTMPQPSPTQCGAPIGMIRR